MSDHVFDHRIVRELAGREAEATVVLAVDRKEPLREDTKVLEKGGKIIDIGKDIHQSNCVDTGIFLCSPRLFSYIEEAMEEGESELADGIARAAKEGEVHTFDIAEIQSYASKMRKEIEPWWIDIDTEEDLRRAKRMVVENASKSPSDALACYVHKPIENRLVVPISRLGVTPNQLSVIVNVLAYVATALFLLGHLLPASVLTFVVGIADGLDGKLARVKFETSRLGSLEHSFDLLFEFSWFMALSWFLSRSMESRTPLILCTFIILFVAFYRHVYDQFRKAMGRSLDDYGRFERIFRRVAGRRNLYNIPILVSILLGAPLFSLIFVALHSGVTAVVYSTTAVKHMYAADRNG
jgi:CDP-L-myo-inositol myo-inositolphosphotransferase